MAELFYWIALELRGVPNKVAAECILTLSPQTFIKFVSEPFLFTVHNQRFLLHLGESSSVSKEVRSMFCVFRSVRLSWSAAAGTAGGSSSSSWVGCREPSIVSSVVQLKVKRRERERAKVK